MYIWGYFLVSCCCETVYPIVSFIVPPHLKITVHIVIPIQDTVYHPPLWADVGEHMG